MEIIDLSALMTKKEKLSDELKPYLQKLGRGHTMLNHPLVQELFINVEMAALPNLRLKEKQRMLSQYKKDKNIMGYVWAHERPYRLQALQDVNELFDLTDKQYWDLLSNVWSDSENIWQNDTMWRVMLNDTRPGKHHMMDAKEKRLMKALPEVITIFRGVNHKDQFTNKGLSWTMDRDKANWFAVRYTGVNVVLSACVKKEHVHAVLLGRNEEEIITEKPFHIERHKQ